MKRPGSFETSADCWPGLFPDGNGGGGPSPHMAQAELARLSRTIEGEIIPRLMLAFDSGAATDTPQDMAAVDTVDEFVRLLLAHDASVATRFVNQLRAGGTPLPVIYLELLAPAARRLGQLWEEDYCSFTDVTVGVCRMHQVLLAFSPCFRAATADDGDKNKTAMFLPVPGEQHTFGLFMVVEFFRRAGWNVWSGAPSAVDEVRALVRAQYFAVVGFSLSAERHLGRLTECIADLRRCSANAEVRVLVGGRLFIDQPGLIAEVGADAAARDGQDAVRLAGNLRLRS
ncbi:MAG TPA: cobalamin B12-binding domain-containing protein [Woeseiaceae bacterium]